jgi:hypothetical protein
MKNITLAIDEATLRAARKYAAECETTVNALVREYLAQLVAGRDLAATAREELVRMSEESKGRSGPGWAWNREDLYAERAVLPRHERAVLRGDGARGRRKQKGAGR